MTGITLMSLVSNGLVMPVVLRSREIREDPATPLLVALSISDFIQGAAFGLLSSVLSWTDANADSVSNGLARFHTFALLHTRMASLNLVGSLAVVKMVTIVKPLRAVDILSKRRIWMVLLACCAVPLTVSLASFIEPVGYSYTYKNSYFLNRGILAEIIRTQIFTSLFIFIISYMIIFIVVVKQFINMRRLVLPTGQAGAQDDTPSPVMAAFRAGKGIIALCTVYLLVYTTGLILTSLNAGHTTDARFVIYRLYDCNGFINVFAHISFCKPAKKELKKVLGRWRNQPAVESFNITQSGTNAGTQTNNNEGHI